MFLTTATNKILNKHHKISLNTDLGRDGTPIQQFFVESSNA